MDRIAVLKPHIRMQRGIRINGIEVPWVCYQLEHKPSYGTTPMLAFLNFLARNG